jgi:hypothetical protein
VFTVRDLRLFGKRNSALLTEMQRQGIEILVTVDQNLRYQQNLAAFGVSIVVLIAVSNRLADLVPLVPAVIQSLGTIKPGMVVEVGPTP